MDENLAPFVDIEVKQAGVPVNVIDPDNGTVSLIATVNDVNKDGIENTALSVKDHRQMMQRSFCIESLLKPATAEALKIVVSTDMERKKAAFSPTGGVPVSPPSSPQSPSSSSSEAVIN